MGRRGHGQWLVRVRVRVLPQLLLAILSSQVSVRCARIALSPLGASHVVCSRRTRCSSAAPLAGCRLVCLPACQPAALCPRHCPNDCTWHASNVYLYLGSAKAAEGRPPTGGPRDRGGRGSRRCSTLGQHDVSDVSRGRERERQGKGCRREERTEMPALGLLLVLVFDLGHGSRNGF